MATQASELAAPATMQRSDAKRLTAQIRRQLGDVQSRSERLAEMVRRAHADRVWEALGYGSWNAWLKAEFPELTRGQKYRLVAWGEVVGELEAAAGAPLEVSARQAVKARKAGTAEVAGRVRERLAGRPAPTADDRRDALAGALAEPIEATATEPSSRKALARDGEPNGPTLTARALLTSLVAVEPAEADVDEGDIDGLMVWAGRVRTAVRRRRASDTIATARPMSTSLAEAYADSASRSPTTSVPAGSVSTADQPERPAPGETPRPEAPEATEPNVAGCAHPANRRLGPVCTACRTKVG